MGSMTILESPSKMSSRRPQEEVVETAMRVAIASAQDGEEKFSFVVVIKWMWPLELRQTVAKKEALEVMATSKVNLTHPRGRGPKGEGLVENWKTRH